MVWNPTFVLWNFGIPMDFSVSKHISHNTGTNIPCFPTSYIIWSIPIRKNATQIWKNSSYNPLSFTIFISTLVTSIHRLPVSEEKYWRLPGSHSALKRYLEMSLKILRLEWFTNASACHHWKPWRQRKPTRKPRFAMEIFWCFFIFLVGFLMYLQEKPPENPENPPRFIFWGPRGPVIVFLDGKDYDGLGTNIILNELVWCFMITKYDFYWPGSMIYTDQKLSSVTTSKYNFQRREKHVLNGQVNFDL